MIGKAFRHRGTNHRICWASASLNFTDRILAELLTTAARRVFPQHVALVFCTRCTFSDLGYYGHSALEIAGAFNPSKSSVATAF
jgi:hypothetical protein